MGLFLSTTGGDVVIAELGITIVHPTTDYEISDQFTADEIRHAGSLTTSITNGSLAWKKTSGGSVETPADYDPDFLDIEREHTGTGAESDRTATIDDLIDITKDGSPILSNVRSLDFQGDLTVTDEGGGVASVYNDAAEQAVQLFQMAFITSTSTYKEVGNQSWTDVAQFRFPGTTKIGIISQIILLAGNSTAGKTSGYRIIDVKHSNNLIAQVLAVPNLYPYELDMGTLSNLSSDSAIWLLQAKIDQPGNKVRIGSISYEY